MPTGIQSKDCFGYGFSSKLTNIASEHNTRNTPSLSLLVKHLSPPPKAEGSCPTTAVGSGRDKMPKGI